MSIIIYLYWKLSSGKFMDNVDFFGTVQVGQFYIRLQWRRFDVRDNIKSIELVTSNLGQ